MSKRLKNFLRNGGTPFPCRLDFQDGSPCEKKFADSRSREMHEKDFNHKRKNPKNMTRQHQHQGRAIIVHSSGGSTTTTTTRKPEDKVHFLIDFLTPVMGICSACQDEGEVLPITGKCILCDPVLTTLAIVAEEKAQKKVEDAAKGTLPKPQDQTEWDAAPWAHWHGGI